MTDFSTFNESSYLPTLWINDILKNMSPFDDSLESKLSTISMKLHIMSQDYTDQLETSMVESMSTMPRILNEIKKIEVQLKLTEHEMNSVSAQLNTFDERNFSGVEDLSRLDLIKTNMEKCKSTLEEHARWSQLVREAQNMLNENGSCTSIAEEVEIMFRSLKILEKLPGHDERKSTCETMKISLLQSLAPKVKRGILSNDFILLQDFLYVYKKMGREKELEEQYVAARPVDTVAAWSQVPGHILEDLTVFLSRVNQFVVREELAVVQLFGADRGTKLLCEMLQSVFKPFHAAISQNIFSVTDVFDSYCAVEGFVLRTLPLLVRAGQQAANETNKSIFSSLVTFLPTYVDIENGEAHRLMLDLVNSVTFGCDADSLDGGGLDNGLFGSERDLGEQLNSYSDGLVCAVDSVHICFEASLRRAVCFMGGVRSKAVITGLFTNLADFAKQMAIRIEDLAVASGAASVDLKLEDNNEEDKSSNSSKALSLGQQLDSCDIDNRLLIACSLRALQTVGRFLLRVDQVKHLTIQSLLELNGAIFPNGQNTVTFGQVLDNSISCAAFTVLQDPLEISELWSFLVLVGNSQRHTTLDMFSSILAPSLRRMQLSACDLLFNLSITLPDKLFSNIFADECWSDSANSTESILPQSVVTQVGEHLLSLVQELEAFASSDALEDLLFVREQTVGLVVKSHGWNQMGEILQISDNIVLARVCQKMNSGKALDILEKTLFATSNEMDSTAFSTVDEADSSAVLIFVNEWLDVFSDAAVGMLLSKVAQISLLTSGGIAQLLTDLNYMRNVAIAVGIRPHPLLTHVQRLLEARSFSADMLAAIEMIIFSTGGDVQSFARFDQCILQAMVRGGVSK